MALITAQLSNYRQSPRKVRLIADLVRGKKVDRALNDLEFTMKRSADPVRKLILSAVANAKNNFKLRGDEMIVREIRVDKGMVMKRQMPKAFGRSGIIRKKMSHIKVVLEAPEEAVQKEAKKAVRKPRAKTVKKAEVKK